MKTIILVAVTLIGCALAQWPPVPPWLHGGSQQGQQRPPFVGAPRPPPFFSLPQPVVPNMETIFLSRILAVLEQIESHNCNGDGSGPVLQPGGPVFPPGGGLVPVRPPGGPGGPVRPPGGPGGPIRPPGGPGPVVGGGVGPVIGGGGGAGDGVGPVDGGDAGLPGDGVSVPVIPPRVGGPPARPGPGSAN